MSATNVGGQTIYFDFKHPAKGSEFNKLLTDIIVSGIYKGAKISVIGGWGGSKTIQITPFTIAINEGGTANYPDKLVIIRTNPASTIDYTFTSNAAPFLYCTYGWQDVIENWLDFNVGTTAAAIYATNPHAIIFGHATFDGITENVNAWSYEYTTTGLISDFTNSNYSIKYNVITETIDFIYTDITGPTSDIIMRLEKDGDLYVVGHVNEVASIAW